MAEVAIALAARLSCVKKGVLDDVGAFSNAVFQANITNGFATWRMFEPLAELAFQAAPSLRPARIRTCYAEFAADEVRDDAGEMHVLRAHNTIVNVQSWSDHKAKELCGRAIGLRYHWNGKEFISRPDVRKMVLVLDGNWSQAELDALMRSGWDDIFYADEMDRLVKAIV